MKTIFNKQKRSVAGVLIALTALTTALTGCQEDFELDLPLAGSARELSLTKDAGSTHVLVYSNGDWTARFTRPVKWASLNKLQGYGNNEIVFTYSANYGISRKIGVVFEKGSLTDTVMFSQAGAITDASLSFSKPAVTLLKSRSQIFTPISTNLRYCIDDLEASVTYYDNDGLPNDPVTVLTRAEEGEEGGEGEGGDEPQAQPVEPWISNVSATYKGITFEVTDNDSGFARIADLTLFIEDAEGMYALCFYYLSPGPSRDQTMTGHALIAINEFMSRYPQSDRVENFRKINTELTERLHEKAYLNAYTYYKTGKYKSAIVAFKNALKQYPESKRREEIMYLIVDSGYRLASNSISEKQTDRYLSMLDSYLSFKEEFPESTHIKSLDRMAQQARDYLDRNNKDNNI